jgi:hypothetical protein
MDQTAIDAEHMACDRVRALVKELRSEGSEFGEADEFVATADEYNALVRRAGLLGTFDDLKTSATARDLRLPGHFPAQAYRDGRPYADMLLAGSEELLRAWAKTFDPTRIDPANTNRPVGMLWW